MFTLQDAIKEQWTRHSKFYEGLADGMNGAPYKDYVNVDGQAYDRGYECGLQQKNCELDGIYWGKLHDPLNRWEEGE